MFKPSYTGKRSDITSLIDESANTILDVGCSNGALGENIKKQNRNSVVWGIELDSEMGDEAKKKLDKVIIGNAEEIILGRKLDATFDCIIFADILEHLYDPWSMVKEAHHLLNDKGMIITSLPNIGYYKTFTNLLFKRSWKYESRGIFDKTHLRFFTKKNIEELFTKNGFRIVGLERKMRLIDRPSVLNKASKYLNIPLLRDFFTFQYIISVRKD